MELSIIPCNTEDFVAYSENANQIYGFELNQTNSAIPYGVLPPWERAQVQKPYGVFSGRNMDERFGRQSAADYDFPDAKWYPLVAYGYPCGAQDAGMKYGYFCGAQDAGMKYGYFCGAQDAVMKYGYPCGAQSVSNECEPFITRPRYPRR